MKLQLPRGMKDYCPEEQILRNKVISVLKSVFEKYGFAPLDTPVIERMQILASKYAGGEEILKETFQFKDRGGRMLGLRYDLTVPFCRFVGMNPNLKMPFKRYSIGKVFRDGPVSSDRVREFIQCDADVVGTESVLAAAEFINISNDVFNELGIKFELRINNRKILNGILETVGLKDESIILTIDKLDKIGKDGVEEELKIKGCKPKQVKNILELVNSSLSKLKKLIKSSIGQEGIKEVEEVLKYSKGLNVKFSASLARGLSYYTGIIYEVYSKEGGVKTAIGGGGRYDNLIKGLLNSKQEYPAIGISFGLDRICNVLKNKGVKTKKTLTQLYIIPIKTTSECVKISRELRKQGINVDMDLNNKSISKNLQYANSYEIPYVLLVGEKELRKKKVKLRNMNTGKESLISVKNVVKKLNNEF